MTIPDLIAQLRQTNPELADQLSEQITGLAKEALLDIEQLLNEQDTNIFSVSKYYVGSIESLSRPIAELNDQPIEQVMLDIRHGKDWQEEQADCIPDWSDSTEFPSAIKG